MRGELRLSAWYGAGCWPVEIVRETPKRYLIKALASGTMIPGGRRLQAGETAYVDKAVVEVERPRAEQ